MTRKLFGTDGIRGKANEHPMTAMTALMVGQAAALHFKRGDHRHRVIIGKDTRLSGYMLENALTSGFLSCGMDVILSGPVPTPAVAMLTRSLRADFGVMISASHNPYHDNGIKFFGPDGYKLSDDVEMEIEKRLDSNMAPELADAADLGRAKRLDDVVGRYTEYVKQTFPKQSSLDGMKIVLDCANGAAYKVAPEVLWELGAEVVKIGVSPNGFNINDGCGSTATEAMQAAVVEHGADIGIALDGDADRVLISDEKGQLVDGDQLMGLIAADWNCSGLLKGGHVVATVMSNLGLEKYLEGQDVGLKRTGVGDRYVVEEMRRSGCNVGGEQSGHIVLGDYATTGDGLMAALQVLAVLSRNGKPASEACRLFDPFPQLLKNVRFQGTSPLELDSVQTAIGDAEKRLDGTGRVLIRKSGTEPLIRVMAEGENEGLVAEVVDGLVDLISKSAA
ncbi:phosphoglucosamine mutase [Magnetovibrio sp. PR-2]|uniref:phosphoglucosamine mutase n=1 Tax=Magnetovibrio sp. PR-2 TaxID=3120356 RepID=UPI002FCE3E49